MKKSKKCRVSWPSDNLLCQVKIFRKEECPAKVASDLRKETEYASKLSLIKWKRPPKFILDEALLVGSGGESTETRSENLRISCVLEAFYPHRSAIPNRPCISPAVEAERFDDSATPNISLIPIDDEEPEEHGPDLSLAASTALSALMKSNEQGSMVDTDLLIKLLTDPNVVNILMNKRASKPLEAASNNLTTSNSKPILGPQHLVPVSSPTSSLVPKLTQPAVSSAMSMSLQKHAPLSHTSPLPRIEYPYSTVKSSLVKNAPESNPLFLNSVHPKNMNHRDEQVSAKPAKTAEYYKNLIREHGGVVQATTNETNNHHKARGDNVKVVKVKFQKPCIFFGRPKGCRLGDSCLYLHDSSKRLLPCVADRFPKAKRLKFST